MVNKKDKIKNIISSMDEIVSLIRTNKYISADDLKKSVFNNERAINILAVKVKELAQVVDELPSLSDFSNPYVKFSDRYNK